MTISVYMSPQPDKLNESGILRVVQAYRRYLVDYGFKFINSDQSADLIVSHAASYPKPTICHLHGLYWSADYPNVDAWQWQTNAFIVEAIRHAKQVTVPSKWVAETIKRDMRFSPYVVPHGIEWQDWQHKEESRGYVLWNKNRQVDVCDNSILVDLIKNFPNVDFLSTFPPRGLSPAQMEGWPKNLKVTEDGVVSYDRMKRMVQRAGIYLSTTKETFGIGVLEAMAAGIPVLGYAYGGNLDLIEHGTNGYLAEPDNFEDLSDGLNYCLKYRDILGANGREMAKEWTWEKPIAQVAEIYKAALVDEFEGRPMKV